MGLDTAFQRSLGISAKEHEEDPTVKRQVHSGWMNTHPRNKKAGPLTIRVAGEQELKRFNRLLDERHPQQTPHPVGRELRGVIEQDGEWIAVMLR
jgi:hypothetical protein